MYVLNCFLFYYYFNIGYLFHGIDFACSITSLVYPIWQYLLISFQELKWTGSSGAWMDIIFINKMS